MATALSFCANGIVLILGVLSQIGDTEYAAIKAIHKQLDDNADGSVDLSESAEVSIPIFNLIPCVLLPLHTDHED